MAKFVLRSRKVWAVITLLAGMLGVPKEIMALMPAVEQAAPLLEQAMTTLLPALLALWSAYRPDNAALTPVPFAAGNAALIPRKP